MAPRTYMSSEQHLDWFSWFCSLHSSPVCPPHTHRHADHATCDICTNRRHLRTACTWRSTKTRRAQ